MTKLCDTTVVCFIKIFPVIFFANRDSPAREIQNIAKKRALERRERERLREQSKPRKKVVKSPVLTVLYVPVPVVFTSAMSHGTNTGIFLRSCTGM
jgi:hypothetical protein